MTTPEPQTDGWVPALTFGAKLALIRQHKGWNIKEAAIACDVRPQSWRGWELENRLPHDQISVVEKIAERTGVDRNWLLFGGALAEPVARVPASRGAGSRLKDDLDRLTGRPRSWSHIQVAHATERPPARHHTEEPGNAGSAPRAREVRASRRPVRLHGGVAR